MRTFIKTLHGVSQRSLNFFTVKIKLLQEVPNLAQKVMIGIIGYTSHVSVDEFHFLLWSHLITVTRLCTAQQSFVVFGE